jgi:hypothetical protein
LLEEQPSLSISRSLAVETDNDVCEMVPNKISIEMRDMDNTTMPSCFEYIMFQCLVYDA